MSKFHINPVTGNVGRCRAAKGECPFGGPQKHFATEREAAENYEVVMGELTLPEPTVKELIAEDMIQAAEREAALENSLASRGVRQITHPLKGHFYDVVDFWGEQSLDPAVEPAVQKLYRESSMKLETLLEARQWEGREDVAAGIESLLEFSDSQEIMGTTLASEGREDAVTQAHLMIADTLELYVERFHEKF